MLYLATGNMYFQSANQSRALKVKFIHGSVFCIQLVSSLTIDVHIQVLSRTEKLCMCSEPCLSSDTLCLLPKFLDCFLLDLLQSGFRIKIGQLTFIMPR